MDNVVAALMALERVRAGGAASGVRGGPDGGQRRPFPRRARDFVRKCARAGGRAVSRRGRCLSIGMYVGCRWFRPELTRKLPDRSRCRQQQNAAHSLWTFCSRPPLSYVPLIQISME